jgi:hypothetical protein
MISKFPIDLRPLLNLACKCSTGREFIDLIKSDNTVMFNVSRRSLALWQRRYGRERFTVFEEAMDQFVEDAKFAISRGAPAND